MPAVKELTVIFLAAVIDFATTTPTLAVKYTLYGTTKTWNEARAVCVSNGQQMLKLDTKAKFDNFMAWRNVWEANGQLTEDIWTGLHQHVLTDPKVFNLEWDDCEPLGDWTLWDNYEPNLPETEKCIRIHFTTKEFRTTKCSFNRQVACEESTDECTFERFDGQDVAALTSASSTDVSIDDCKHACLTYTGSVQCVAVVYDSETTSGDPCSIYTRQQVYINDNPEMTSSAGRTVLLKRCVEGDYKSTVVSVPANTDNEPITMCPVTSSTSTMTSLTYIMTSEPISVSPSYPSTSADSRLSVSTDTQPETMYTSYASFSESETVSTPSNIFPEKNSVASSVSLTKASVTETQAYIASFLISPMTTHTPTPISLYSSTTSGGFKDSTSHKLYWSTDRLASSVDSTMSKTVFVSIIVPLETSAMTMSESSQMTTLTDAVDKTSSCGTKSTSTVVSDPLEPETNTQLSNLDLDPFAVALSTDTSTPNEKQCVCTCKHLLMSVSTNFNDCLLVRKNLSSYRRSKTSASDDRVSARAIGSSGLAIILLVTAVIVCIDVDRIIRAMRRCRKVNKSMNSCGDNYQL
ncbi:uncharacterized protein [Haliotis asinina]|uniref:uncharacterized protein n=1 Tax=Haliotis asinina TaxID=109174 RepID=UPI003531F79D